jgi:hypothetical protein
LFVSPLYPVSLHEKGIALCRISVVQVSVSRMMKPDYPQGIQLSNKDIIQNEIQEKA